MHIISKKDGKAKDLGKFVNKTQLNGGYYFARYEAGKGTDNAVISKYDQTVWNNITPVNAMGVARNLSYEFIESDLMNSYSWDTTIVFIQKYSGDSSYANKTSVNSSLLNTGKAGDKVCNIHDMASNCMELSTEDYTNTGSYPCVARGGRFDATISAGYRSASTGAYNNKEVSFRVILYIK